MASVDDLSNNEIRTKLAEFGAPVGPVTETTRKVLLKKLKHLMVQRELSAVNSNSSKSRKSFSRFSSGEDDSDEDVKAKKENTKMPPPSTSFRSTRRQTVGIPRVNEPTTAPVSKSRRSIQVQPTSPKPLVEEPEKSGRIGRYSSHVSVSTNRPSPSSNNVTTRRGSQRPTVSLAEEYDDGSDSDVAVTKTVTSRFRESKTVAVDKGEPSGVSSPSVLSRLSGFQSSYLGLTERNDEETKSDSASTAVSDLLSFRKRYTIPSEPTPAVAPDTSYPYTSNFARRLTLARGRKPGSSLSDSSPRTLELLKIRDPDIVKDDGLPSSIFTASRENGHFFSSQVDSSLPYTSKRSHDISDEFKTTEDDVAFWKNSQTVSMILLAVAFVFFLGLGVVYMNVRSKDTTTFFAENERNVFPICHSGTTGIQPCILGSDLDPATELMKILYPRLVEQAVASECGPPLRDGSYVNPIMSESEALKFLSEQTGMELDTLKKNLHNLKLMLVKNPHWGVTVTSPYQPVDGREQVEDVKVLMEHGGMRVNNPVLPFGCWLRKMLVLALLSVAFVGGGLGVLYGIQRAVVWHSQQREKEKQAVYALVQQIIELLQSHHHTAGSPGGIGTSKSFLAINHVRDQLIPPQDRNRMAGLWDKAVSFLENNESRVRHEVQIIAGEECPVWRWLPTSYANASPAGQKTPQHSPLPE